MGIDWIILFVSISVVITEIIACPSSPLCHCGQHDDFYCGCSGERLTQLPPLMPSEQKFDNFYIWDCQLDLVQSKAFEGFLVEKLHVANQSLLSIHPQAFYGIPGVTHIYLSSNRLKAIPPTLFQDTPELIFLSLSENLLQYVPTQIFNGLYALEELSLDRNHINVLQSDVFRDLINIKFINLKHNNLGYICIDTFLHTPTLQQLLLKGNPLGYIDFCLPKCLPQLVLFTIDAQIAPSITNCTCNPIGCGSNNIGALSGENQLGPALGATFSMFVGVAFIVGAIFVHMRRKSFRAIQRNMKPHIFQVALKGSMKSENLYVLDPKNPTPLSPNTLIKTSKVNSDKAYNKSTTTTLEQKSSKNDKDSETQNDEQKLMTKKLSIKLNSNDNPKHETHANNPEGECDQYYYIPDNLEFSPENHELSKNMPYNRGYLGIEGRNEQCSIENSLNEQKISQNECGNESEDSIEINQGEMAQKEADKKSLGKSRQHDSKQLEDNMVNEKSIRNDCEQSHTDDDSIEEPIYEEIYDYMNISPQTRHNGETETNDDSVHSLNTMSPNLDASNQNLEEGSHYENP